jgi:hypothetical protein
LIGHLRGRGLDWLDIQFGRSTRVWSNNLLFPWDFEKWRENSRENVDPGRYPRHPADNILTAASGGSIASSADWEKKAAEIRKSATWMLGEEPPMMPPGAGRGAFGGRGRRPAARRRTGGTNPGQVTPDLVNWVIARGGNHPVGCRRERSNVVAQPDLRLRQGRLCYPTGTLENAKLPVVIWLHGYSYQLGYMWVYHNDLHPILALVKAGYAVLAFDQSGFGSRMSETAAFGDRYPHWSQMGRMVEDPRAAIDALEKDGMVDAQRVYLFG